MNKRIAARIISFTAALVVVLGVFAVHGAQTSRGYQRRLEYTYQRA